MSICGSICISFPQFRRTSSPLPVIQWSNRQRWDFLRLCLRKPNYQGTKTSQVHWNQQGRKAILFSIAIRLDACCSRIETAARMNQVTSVVKGMDKSLVSMDIEKLSVLRNGQILTAIWRSGCKDRVLHGIHHERHHGGFRTRRTGRWNDWSGCRWNNYWNL